MKMNNEKIKVKLDLVVIKTNIVIALHGCVCVCV